MGPVAVPGDDGNEILVWRRVFGGRAEEAARARRFVRFLLEGYAKADDVVEVAAELFSNAVNYTLSSRTGGRVTVEVRRWPGCVVALGIEDAGGESEPRASSVRPVDLDDLDALAEGGRGLAIVGELADCWGWAGDVNGRVVTALFTT